MSYALAIPAPTGQRRDACPSLDAPMQTGDGLLARLRIKGGWLAPQQLRAIAELAQQYGNGLIEITARGNLQIRGLSQASHLPFAAAIRAIVPIEQGLVVETPPLAGDDPHEIANPLPLAQAIRELAAPLASSLGPKVSVVVDGGGKISLASLKADIRLLALAHDHWVLAVGGGKPEPIRGDAVLKRVVQILRDLSALGPGARATDLSSIPERRAAPLPFVPAGTFDLRQGSATGIALPFGSANAASLVALSIAASHHGITEFCLAPQHGLLAINAGPAFVDHANQLGFITTPADPRTRISACIGRDGCASGHIPARSLAASLAASLPATTRLHLSGCAKGCAHPRRADVTLVGRPDGYGLVIGGTAGDTPRAVLRADQLESALRQE